ncbi:EAL domain-containing protein [Pseudomonas moorei]|nr:EAL domain-containing protein [Pseudomonas moorei]
MNRLNVFRCERWIVNQLNLHYQDALLRNSRNEKKFLRAYRLRVFGCGLLLLLTVLLVLTYRQAERQAESDIRNLTLVLEARLDSGLLQPLQGSLRRIARMLERSSSQGDFLNEEIIEDLRDQMLGIPQGVDFDLIDTNGQPLFSSKGAVAQPSSDKLRYWSFLSRIPSGKIAGRMGEMLIEQDKGHQLLRVAMPVSNHEQRFVGWITASLPLSAVLELFDKVDVGLGGTITIRRVDEPEIFLRAPPLENPYAFLMQDALSEQLASGVREGKLHMRSHIDGVERLYGFKRIGDFPLALSIGLACQDYLEEWYFMSGVSTALSVIFFLIILGFDKRLQRVRLREAEAEKELRQADDRTRNLLDTVGHAILGIDLDGRCVFGNAACRRLFNIREGQSLTNILVDEYLHIPSGECATRLTEKILAIVADGEELHCNEDLRIADRSEVMWMDIRAYPSLSDGELVGAIVTLQDISEHKKAIQCISFMAYHDALTGLPNRRQIQEHVERTIVKHSMGVGGFSLLYLDVDNFKIINDSLGHVAGDAVLCMLAERLKQIEGVDSVARLGGDEFLIMVPSSSLIPLKELIPKLSARVREPWSVEGCLVEMELSIGVAKYPNHGDSFNDLFKAADIALNQAKKNGRNHHFMYNEEMGGLAIKRLQLQMELRGALQNEELEIYYQPQIELTTGDIVGAEALLRWCHPQRGMIPPSEFIPEAEASGLILPIGNWILRTVCNQAVAWQRMGLGRRVVAVNCSAVQFKQGDFVNDVAQALADSGLEPALLELELTESILIEDTERMIATVRKLKAMGVKLSIDDFGTGYSSMAYLKHLAVDKLKIDRSFIRYLAENPDDRVIVQAMVTLAHNLKLQVVAEGVETEAALRILVSQGCDEVQGYFFSRPLPVIDFETFISNRDKVKELIWQEGRRRF